MRPSIEGTPADWPLHEEIQAAKRGLREAEGWHAKLEALAEVDGLCRERNAMMDADLGALAAAGEELVV